jgi:hypothetical protein
MYPLPLQTQPREVNILYILQGHRITAPNSATRLWIHNHSSYSTSITRRLSRKYTKYSNGIYIIWFYQFLTMSGSVYTVSKDKCTWHYFTYFSLAWWSLRYMCVLRMESVLLKVIEWTGEFKCSAPQPNGWLSELHTKRTPDDGDLQHRNICRGILVNVNKERYSIWHILFTNKLNLLR